MLNACQVKLNIEIELYRTTRHENTYCIVLSMQRYRVSKKAGQDQEVQSHKESTTYKYIPRHLYIISFEQVVFCKQKG